jgi:hypothetical protein
LGERAVRVPPNMMGQSRRGERERALEIRLLADHRSDIVAERTRQISRLRWHLVDLCPDLEAGIPARQLDTGGMTNARPYAASTSPRTPHPPAPIDALYPPRPAKSK